MKKFLIILLLWCSVAWADTSTVTVTTVSTSVVTASYQRTSVIVKNIGTTTCYLTDEATATTDDYELEGGEIYVATERFSKRQLNAIVSAGTTELRVWTGKQSLFCIFYPLVAQSMLQ